MDIKRRMMLLGGTPAYYVDSVAGNDANSGISPAAPLATIAALTTKDSAAPRPVWRLKRDGVWREQVTAPRSNMTVEAYGSGTRKPILDAADVISTGAWSKTAGQTNVYQCTWTPTVDATPGCCPNVWEDGVRLQRVNSLATCDSTAGSYYASTTYAAGVAAPLYVHATGNGNPAANGKQYEQSVRAYGVYAPDNCIVRGVHTRRNQHFYGSLVTGRNSYITTCLAEDGARHNLLIASGVCEDTICWKADKYINAWGQTGILFVGYNTITGARDSLTFRRCKAVGEVGDSVAATQGTFHCHGANNCFGALLYEDCEAYYLTDGFDGDNLDSITVRNCLVYENANTAVVVRGTCVVDGLEWYTTAARGTYCRGLYAASAGASVSVSNFIANQPSGEGIKTELAANVSVQNSTFVHRSATALENAMFINASTGAGSSAIVNRRNIFAGLSKNTNDGYMAIKGTYTLDSDYNNFDNSDNAANGKVILGGNSYKPISAYLTANPTQDTHSKVGVPGWAGDPLARNYAVTAGGNAGLISAGASANVRTVDYAALVTAVAAM